MSESRQLAAFIVALRNPTISVYQLPPMNLGNKAFFEACVMHASAAELNNLRDIIHHYMVEHHPVIYEKIGKHPDKVIRRLNHLEDNRVMIKHFLETAATKSPNFAVHSAAYHYYCAQRSDVMAIENLSIFLTHASSIDFFRANFQRQLTNFMAPLTLKYKKFMADFLLQIKNSNDVRQKVDDSIDEKTTTAVREQQKVKFSQSCFMDAIVGLRGTERNYSGYLKVAYDNRNILRLFLYSNPNLTSFLLKNKAFLGHLIAKWRIYCYPSSDSMPVSPSSPSDAPAAGSIAGTSSSSLITPERDDENTPSTSPPRLSFFDEACSRFNSSSSSNSNATIKQKQSLPLSLKRGIKRAHADTKESPGGSENLTSSSNNTDETKRAPKKR